MELCHQNTIRGREDHQCRTQCHQNTIGGRAMPTPIIRVLLAGWRRTKVEHSAIRIHWRARNADTNHQNTISGREDRESRTQCHQNTIGGRAMPTPVIRILLAGGRTTNVEHSAIRILLAGGRTTNVEHSAIRILLAGGRTVGHPVWDLQSY